MNKVVLKNLVKRNPVYISAKKLKNRCGWELGKERHHAAAEMTPEQAEECLRKLRPDPGCEQPDVRMDEPGSRVDLSVIIPVYNVEKYLSQCLDSVLNQDFGGYSVEVIAVNDGSPDGSARILERYAAHPLVRVIHKENGGLSSARNAGLRNASGRYIMFLDSDDYLVNDCIRLLLDKATENTCDIVQMNYAHLAGSTLFPSGLKWGFSETESYMEKCTIPGHACMKLFSRSLFSGLSFPKGYWYEDTIVHMILFERCKKLGTISRTGYIYRLSETSISASKRKSYNCLDAYWIVKKVLQMRGELDMPVTEGLYVELLNHLSGLLLHRIKSVEEETCVAVFVLSCELVSSVKAQLPRQPQLTEELQYLEKAFLEKDYGLWHWYSSCHGPI